MRTHVSKVLVGIGIVSGTPNVDGSEVAVAPWSAIQALLDAGTALPAAAASDSFGFVKADGAGSYITAGPFPSATSIVASNAYSAGTAKTVTLTVDVTNLVAGTPYQFKVAYHDNLSIVPNQIKSTKVSVVFESGMTATTYAAAIAAEFNKQMYLFVTVAAAAGVITFTQKAVSTASSYNRIDKPEYVNFEVFAGNINFDNSTPVGAFVIAAGNSFVPPQGTAAQIAYMEDQAQGRRGFSDRRMWNNTKKFIPSAVPGVTYGTVIVTADKNVEGDLQDLRANPIGAVAAVPQAGLAAFIAALETIIG